MTAPARPARLKLIVAYDGRPFEGWQSQASGKTVQDFLCRAFAQVCGAPCPVQGAGRTDAGVHALAQCAHADVPASRFAPADWLRAVNAHLPPEIRVMKCVRAPKTFHARFSARGKIYAYRIWNAPIHPPLEIGRSWHVSGKIDAAALRSAAEMFCGTHDFASVAANRRKRDENTTRTIDSIGVRKRGPLLTLEFRGNGFLYKMVRLITGSLVRHAQGRASSQWIADLLKSPGSAKTSFAAPAHGVYLVRVLY
jgi:tRNA pseudouridine38-40 synthase